MKQIVTLVFTLIVLPWYIYGQYPSIGFSNSPKPDVTLKEVWEYKVHVTDSTLSAKEYYSEGLLKRREDLIDDSLLGVRTFKYYKNQQVSHATHKRDTSTTITVYTYDQYNNPYLMSFLDSVPDIENPYRVRYKLFTNYIYQDSLILYSNMINDLGWGFQFDHKRYEYDKSRRLTKIFERDMDDTLETYSLKEEIFYDGSGNPVRWLRYCEDPYEGNADRFSRTCDDDQTLYLYNSKKQLVEELRIYHDFGAIQKDTIRYYYDDKNRLTAVMHIMERDVKYITNRYYKY